MFTYKHKDTGVVIEVQSEISAPHWEEVKAPEPKKSTKKKVEKKEE